ncbi:hypothetical protein ISN45_At01g056550 [Arabidopsis thaliana x Arabidopsis arenosa]|nr:hypothetical protein ISN45_At01g056550 [Arabidopsis thaliana x Arabidopsis arenosa]
MNCQPNLFQSSCWLFLKSSRIIFRSSPSLSQSSTSLHHQHKLNFTDIKKNSKPFKKTKTSTMFGVVFPNRSFPIDISTFTQIDTFHWVLDMNHFVGEAYDQISEMCIFLLNNFNLPPDKALAVYVQSPGSAFVFCGAVTLARPSAVLSLQWPEPGSAAKMQLTAGDSSSLSAKIGVSVEDVAALRSLDVVAERRIEKLAMKVGENLFNFMQSFCGVDGSKLVVPMDILDRWFKKFQEKAKRDPDFLKSFAL